jgi:hypothetical protein
MNIFVKDSPQALPREMYQNRFAIRKVTIICVFFAFDVLGSIFSRIIKWGYYCRPMITPCGTSQTFSALKFANDLVRGAHLKRDSLIPMSRLLALDTASKLCPFPKTNPETESFFPFTVAYVEILIIGLSTRTIFI